MKITCLQGQVLNFGEDHNGPKMTKDDAQEILNEMIEAADSGEQEAIKVECNCYDHYLCWYDKPSNRVCGINLYNEIGWTETKTGFIEALLNNFDPC